MRVATSKPRGQKDWDGFELRCWRFFGSREQRQTRYGAELGSRKPLKVIADNVDATIKRLV